MNQILWGGRRAHGLFCRGVVFDGVNDYTTRGADLTGNADGKLGLVSFWFKLNGGDGSAQVIYSSEGEWFQIRRLATNKISIIGSDAGGNNDLSITSNSTYTADGVYHHGLASWDLANNLAHLMMDGVDDEAAGTTKNNDTLDYTRTNHAIGATVAGGSKLDADLAELYINFAEYLDITQAANLAKFIISGRSVDPGLTGIGPTGSQPLCYFSVRNTDVAAAFATNKGSGGDFSITGALALATTLPIL